VPSLAVVERFDVLEDLAGQLAAGRPGASVHELLLEGREEALGNGVVEAVALGAHRDRDAGVAPIPVSSGKTNRHRLDRGGNRQINTAIHRVAVTRLRCHPETRDYIARKRSEGKSTTEAIRCLKRHLTRRI
jgi:hypothetical protein